MALPILEEKLPVDSYTEFRHPQHTTEQSCLMACCSPAALSTLPSGFGQQGQQHHQPDTCSFPPAVCALPQQQQQQRHHQQQQQQQQDQQLRSSRRILSPPACCSSDAAGAYMSPYLSSYQQPRSQNIWPSPPLGPGDIQSCSISFRDSPVCASARLPFYTTSPASPSGWSSGSVSGYPPNTTTTTTGLFDPRSSGDQTLFRVCTPMSAQELPAHHHHQQQQDMSTPYTPGFGAESDADISAGLSMSVPSSDTLPGLSVAQHTPRPPSFAAVRTRMVNSSRSRARMAPQEELAEGREDAEFLESLQAASKPGPAPAEAPVEVITIPDDTAQASTAAGHDEKSDEPYAKLIYRALMSRPNYTMTLQELYQWFIDNTTKAKNPKGGWMNSIRHNLSMNGAFERRDRRRASGPEPSTCVEKAAAVAGESKRANEWVLAEAAIGKGVQSTTRYRKGNSGRRPSRRSASTSQPAGDVGRASQRSSIKALSGQKGGCAARNARVRSHLYGQGLSLAADGRQYRLIQSGLGSPPPSSMPDSSYYSLPIAIPRIDPAVAIQAAPMAAHGHDFGAADAASDLFGLQMAAGPRGNSGGASVSYMGHHHHQQEEPLYTTPFPYGIADVQVHLDYSGEDGSADVSAQLRRYEALTGTPRVGWASPHGI